MKGHSISLEARELWTSCLFAQFGRNIRGGQCPQLARIQTLSHMAGVRALSHSTGVRAVTHGRGAGPVTHGWGAGPVTQRWGAGSITHRQGWWNLSRGKLAVSIKAQTHLSGGPELQFQELVINT